MITENVGRKKQYSAIVFRVHQQKPSYKTKEVLEVLDNEPIVNLKQLELWAWISRYYMTTLGEVMTAGLPNSLKLNSESMYLPSLNKYTDKELSDLKPSEQKIVDALEHNQQMNLKEIWKKIPVEVSSDDSTAHAAQKAVNLPFCMKYKYLVN